MIKKPFTIFNETRNVPLVVYYKGKHEPNLEEWDADLWIERSEDWYALMSANLRDKKVRIIERHKWLRGEIVHE